MVYRSKSLLNQTELDNASTQTDVSKSRVILDSLPSSGSLERRLETMIWEAIPLMLGSSGLEWTTREMGAAFTMGGVSYLP